MYLDPLVSLRFSSFELVLSCFVSNTFCSIPVVPLLSLAHVSLSQLAQVVKTAILGRDEPKWSRPTPGVREIR